MNPKSLSVWIVEDDEKYAQVIRVIIDKSKAFQCDFVFQDLNDLEHFMKTSF